MYTISIEASGINEAKQDLAMVQAVLQQELINAGAFVRDTWKQAVSGRDPLPGMTKRVNDDAYAKSIQTAESFGIMQVIVSPVGYADQAERIENGTPAYDMKPFLLNGPKSRPTKDGMGRYNIIPFRHYTPKSSSSGASSIAVRMQMPKDIYSQAKKLVRSTPNPQSGKVDWGASLRIDDLGGINRTSLYQHKNNQYDGMYRVGAEKHSQYLTFRAVSTPRTVKGKRKGSAPRSWIHPAIPRNPVMEAVYNFCKPKIEENFREVLDNLFK